MKDRKLTPLNPEESAAWDRLLSITLDACDGDVDEADHKTWLAMQERFPRLRDFDGELPTLPEGFWPEGEANAATKGNLRR